MSSSTLEHLPGTELPEGRFMISAAENRALVEALGSDGVQDGLAHPVFGYIAAQRGIGIDVAGLLALADFDIADGPMLASSRLDYARPLRTERAYRVTGRIVAIQRKQGRTAGVFDLLTFEESVLDGPDLVCTVTNVFVLPRRGAT